MEIYTEDLENFSLGSRTEPRNQKRNLSVLTSGRAPLKELSLDKNQISIELKPSSYKNSLSEPVSNIKSRSRIIQKNDKQQQQKEAIVTKPNNIGLKLNSANLAKILDHDTLIEDELGTDEHDDRKLFDFLEKEGRLSPMVLKAFCKSDKIRSVNMTWSYAGKKTEFGEISAAKYSPKLCTKPFYHGFQNLLTIDFTNVKIFDDELRYLIRLPKLQALGLSGTSVSDKGIKYISIHSKFKSTLQCLKICYLEGISDTALKFLSAFTKLKNLDLRGNQNISLSGCFDLIKEPSTHEDSAIFIKLPQKLRDQLSFMHIFYKDLLKNNSNIILDPLDSCISKLSRSEIKSQLTLHMENYNDIYLNQDLEQLQKKLMEIINKRKKEEYLYSCSIDK